MPVEVAEIKMWGTRVGALAWDAGRMLATFEYDKDFLRSGIELAPITMPLGRGIFSFPELDRRTYHGLPGMLADALPDKFGNALIDAWLVQQRRSPTGFSPIERLCYVGKRGMGALQFHPATRQEDPGEPLEIAVLVRLASQALSQKQALDVAANKGLDEAELSQIIRVGTSAGGARAKAVIGWNEETQSVRSGQLDLPVGYRHWLIKFDGVSANGDKELADSLGYGRIEYAYSLMAKAAGVTMASTRLLEEGPRAHFMTERFDRPLGDRLHMQTLAAMAHYDFNRAGAYSYEQAFEVMRRLGLDSKAMEEQFRRAVFNVIARNQDDHTKNISFLMNRRGEWTLSPAYDVTYAYNPEGEWTGQHQMSINNKRDDFTLGDLEALAGHGSLSPQKTRRVLADVRDASQRWPEFADEAGVARAMMRGIAKTFRSLE